MSYMDVDTFERIQRRATKIIRELSDLTHEERLQESVLNPRDKEVKRRSN